MLPRTELRALPNRFLRAHKYFLSIRGGERAPSYIFPRITGVFTGIGALVIVDWWVVGVVVLVAGWFEAQPPKRRARAGKSIIGSAE